MKLRDGKQLAEVTQLQRREEIPIKEADLRISVPN